MVRRSNDAASVAARPASPYRSCDYRPHWRDVGTRPPFVVDWRLVHPGRGRRSSSIGAWYIRDAAAVRRRLVPGTSGPGRRFAESDPLCGDELARAATWQGEKALGRWAGRPLCQRFRLRQVQRFGLRFAAA